MHQLNSGIHFASVVADTTARLSSPRMHPFTDFIADFMGNFQTFRARCVPERREVLVDLRAYKATLPYRFRVIEGVFYFDLNLGTRAISLPDFLTMARNDLPSMARIEVKVPPQKRKVNSQDELGSEAIDRLASGVSQPILKDMSR